MRTKQNSKKKIQLFSTLLACALLSGCATISTPNIEICRTVGPISLGARCGWTLGGEQRKLTLEELVDMIEARPERIVNGTKLEAHGAAYILSSKSYMALKTWGQQACKLLRNRCTEEMKKETEALFANIEIIGGKK